MINTKHLDTIVRNTLQRMNVVDPAMTRLIKGTFLFESNLEDVYDVGGTQKRKRGFMMLDETRFNLLMNEWLKFRQNFKDKIFAATGINVDATPRETLLYALETNIAFMVAITYVYYVSKYKTPPQDSMDALAKCYRDFYYDGPYDGDLLKNFIDYYREVFMDKY